MQRALQHNGLAPTASEPSRLLSCASRMAAPPQMPLAPNATLQSQLHDRLTTTNALGERTHGTLIETYERTGGGGPEIVVGSAGRFFCRCCPLPPRSMDGTRASGMWFSNVYLHMGSKQHWSSFRQAALLDYDEAAWLRYSAGNPYGLSRVRAKTAARTAKLKRHLQLMRRWRGIVHGLAPLKAAQLRAAERVYAPGGRGYEDCRESFVEHDARGC